MLVGWLIMTPIAPWSGECSHIRVSVLEKFGSYNVGMAISICERNDELV